MSRSQEQARADLWSRLKADPQNRAALVTLLCVYAGTLVLFSSTMALRGQLTGRVFVHLSLPMMLEMLFDLPVYAVLRLLAGRAWRWPLLIVFGLLDDLAASWWDTQLRFWAGLLPVEFVVPTFSNGVVRALPVNFYHVGMLIALFAFQEAYFKLKDNQGRLLAAQASERGAHLAALRLQLNPHFLFNSMNALSSLVVTNRKTEAERMIDRLSDFLRVTLGADPLRRVTLLEEFEMLSTYLDIERVRFGDRLTTKLDLPSELEDVRIPPFLLQPLVENAVKYAVAPSRVAVCVVVEARRAGGELVLRVEDDGTIRGKVAAGTGIGLVNVRERLQLEFGSSASLDARQLDRGYRALIRLPSVGASSRALAPA